MVTRQRQPHDFTKIKSLSYVPLTISIPRNKGKKKSQKALFFLDYLTMGKLGTL